MVNVTKIDKSMIPGTGIIHIDDRLPNIPDSIINGFPMHLEVFWLTPILIASQILCTFNNFQILLYIMLLMY